jgi:hypothetical protein
MKDNEFDIGSIRCERNLDGLYVNLDDLIILLRMEAIEAEKEILETTDDMADKEKAHFAFEHLLEKMDEIASFYT